MNYQRVKSSQIHSLAYDPVEETLGVQFNCRGCGGEGVVPGPDGKPEKCSRCNEGVASAYEYAAVPAEVYAGLRDADSIGSAFHKQIKGGGFEFKRKG